MTESSFTPTEELVMEVLAARYRLGEKLWTFSKKPAITKALDKLAEEGLVTVLGGQVENTVRAMMTDAGQKKWLSSDYNVPERLFEVLGHKRVAVHQYVKAPTRGMAQHRAQQNPGKWAEVPDQGELGVEIMYVEEA